jgi:ABC-type branched-subunit amino acid transport system substrate-binding protein
LSELSERARGAAVGLALTFIIAAGCSATRFDQSSCQDHAQCREAFGFGSVCNEQGLCEQARLSARCNATYPEDLFSQGDRYREAIVFGSLMDRSSDAHVAREKAARLAVKEAGGEGGLDGHPVGLVMCNIAQDGRVDGMSRTAAAVDSARFLIETLGVPAIIGPSGSTDVQQVWEAARTAGAMVISPAASSVALSQLEPTSADDRPGLLWRTAPPDSLQGRAIADDMLARKVRQVAVVRENGAYGEGLASVFTARFASGGGAFRILAIGSDSQIGGGAADAVADGAQEVLFISSQQAWVTRFLDAVSGLAAYDRERLFLTDAAADLAVFNGAASALFPRIRGTRPAPRGFDDYVFATFVADYKAEYRGEDPTTAPFSAHAYDATWLVLYGAAWSLLRDGAITGTGISRGLRHVSAGPPMSILPSSWPGVVAAFRNGRGINVSGASGELDFDPVTREAVAPIEIWTVSAAAGRPTISRADPTPTLPEMQARGRM